MVQKSYERNGMPPILPENVILAIQDFFACDSFEEEIACFIKNYNALKDCKFLIYSDAYGVEFPECFKTNYNNDFAIIEIGSSDKYYVVDEKICEDVMRNKQSNYNLDICVELDTQVISYLKNIFKSREEINIPDSKKNLFYYLSQSNVNYSSILYLLENAKKITKDNMEEVYMNLKSYEIFRNFDYRLYVDEGKKCFRNDEANMMINIDNTFNNILSKKYHEYMKDIYDMQEHIYCLLLKAILIEHEYSKKSADNKMKMLVEYVNNNLGVFCEREMTICYHYFNHHENTEKFFKKTKSNSKNILNTVNGMAWDLTHIRLMERLYKFTFDGYVKFGIHPILTYDNGLKDVLKLCSVRKIAIYDGNLFPCFKSSFVEIFPESINLIHNSEVTEKRRIVFMNRNMELIKNELEREMENGLDIKNMN